MTLLNSKAVEIKSKLGNISEVFFVLLLGFGLFIYSSTINAFFTSTVETSAQSYNSYDFIFIVFYDLLVLAIIARFLKFRNWSLKDFNLDFSYKMIGIAALLALTRIFAGIAIINAIDSLQLPYFKSLSNDTISLQINLVSTILIVIVNSVFEEVLLIGYLFKRFENFNSILIITISSLVRASYHTYQGWSNVASLFAMALIFGIYYIKYKKLWPLILAHALGNIFFFLNYHYQWFRC